MKVIDLLNKIANGEEVPKKIKKTWVYEWTYDELRNDFCYITTEGERFDSDWLIINMLDSEVEIIEEDKKIKKIGLINPCESEADAILHKKIDEIIDKINEMGDK